MSLRLEMQRELDELLEGRRERWSQRMVLRTRSMLERRAPSSAVDHLLDVVGAHGIRSAIKAEATRACSLFEHGGLMGEAAVAAAKAAEMGCVMGHVSRLARAAKHARGAA